MAMLETSLALFATSRHVDNFQRTGQALAGK